MYWTGQICIYVQIWVLLPLVVIIFKKSKLLFTLVCCSMIVLSSVYLGYTFWTYKLTVGTLSFEDYYIYAYIFMKPYGQTHGTAFGMLMGWLYLSCLKYRAVTDAEKPNYRILHAFHSKWYPSFIVSLLGLFLFLTVIGLPYDPNNDAYSWDRTQNTLYGCLSNPSYVLAICMMTQSFFFKRLNGARAFLGSNFFMYLSKLNYSVFLLYPFFIFFSYTSA
jgi:hypothetical protein